MRLLVILVVFLVAGCEQSEFSDLKLFMDQAGQGGQHALEPLPQLKQAELYEYVPNEFPDPFKPRSMKPTRSSGGLQPDLNRQKEFLEGFPLDALRMVGTLQKGGQTYALVKTPENALHRVKKGNYMGMNYGLVIAVSETGVELKEMIQDGSGDWAESKAILPLQE